MICAIQWVDESGSPTSDTRPAIGFAWLRATQQTVGGNVVRLSESRRFPICAEHARRLSDPDMSAWRFEPIRTAA
jgi:hypothetical protein